MFSRVRYYSFKTGPSGDKVPALWIFLAVLIIVLLALDPPIMGMIFGSAYVLSGLLITVAGRRNWKLKRDKRPPKKDRTEPVMETEAQAPEDGPDKPRD
jgi:CDP-diacylglycerol--serine O-phosphatidyltransferase